MARLRDYFQSDIRPTLMERMNYSNGMQVPKVDKIVLNMGVGEASQDRKKIETAVEEMSLIAGQKPIVTHARRSIASFKLRDGMIVGCKVTLRGDRMYEFLDRLISVSLPGVRDFQGINPKGFDGRGNYTLGIKEQIIFPEIKVDEIKKITGLDITFVTSAKSDREGLALLKELGLPFKK